MWWRRKSPRANPARIEELEVELGLRPSREQIEREERRLKRMDLNDRIMAVAERNQHHQPRSASEEAEEGTQAR